MPREIQKALKYHDIKVIDKISGTWIKIFERAIKKQDCVMIKRHDNWTFVQSSETFTILVNTIHKHIYESVV